MLSRPMPGRTDPEYDELPYEDDWWSNTDHEEVAKCDEKYADYFRTDCEV